MNIYKTMEDRPSELPTVSQRINTGFGKVYVNITTMDDEPFEVFVKMGKSGSERNAFCEALGIAISWGLRSGADAETVANYLTEIRTDRIQVDNGDDIYSIPDAVGIAMLRYLHDKLGEPIRDGDDYNP